MNNIMFIASDNDQTHGAFRSMVKLCEELVEKYGYNVRVVLPCEGNGTKLLEENNIGYVIIKSYNWVIPVDYSKNFISELKILKKFIINKRAIRRLRKEIQSNKVDLVHINTIYSYVGAKAASIQGVPYIWHLREGLDCDQNRKLWNEKCYHLISQASAIICISDFIFYHYRNRINNNNYVRIYNGIDADMFYYERQQPILYGENVTFLCVGNMEGKKGQESIIRACKLLRDKEISRWKVLFVGSGTKESYYKGLVEEFSLSDSIMFCGAHKDVVNYYKDSDVFLMCSDAEAFGRTTVEAMLAGCLVIGADTGATPEILHNGEFGLLYPQGNVEGLAQKMMMVLENKERMRHMAENGQQFAMKSFNANKNAEQIAKLYMKVLGNHK